MFNSYKSCYKFFVVSVFVGFVKIGNCRISLLFEKTLVMENMQLVKAKPIKFHFSHFQTSTGVGGERVRVSRGCVVVVVAIINNNNNQQIFFCLQQTLVVRLHLYQLQSKCVCVVCKFQTKLNEGCSQKN